LYSFFLIQYPWRNPSFLPVDVNFPTPRNDLLGYHLGLPPRSNPSCPGPKKAPEVFFFSPRLPPQPPPQPLLVFFFSLPDGLFRDAGLCRLFCFVFSSPPFPSDHSFFFPKSLTFHSHASGSLGGRTSYIPFSFIVSLFLLLKRFRLPFTFPTALFLARPFNKTTGSPLFTLRLQAPFRPFFFPLLLNSVFLLLPRLSQSFQRPFNPLQSGVVCTLFFFFQR